jgi:small subunit ribosomal protein S9
MDKIINTLGRRKTAVARIYMKTGSGNILVNGKDYKNYFPTMMLQKSINEPFKVTSHEGQFDIKVNLDGGGITGQAEALRLAISRALVELNEENRPLLKPFGYLTRDPRMVERKKFGQAKARKKFQFSKR